jgi:hypothetical protein
VRLSTVREELIADRAEKADVLMNVVLGDLVHRSGEEVGIQPLGASRCPDKEPGELGQAKQQIVRRRLHPVP